MIQASETTAYAIEISLHVFAYEILKDFFSRYDYNLFITEAFHMNTYNIVFKKKKKKL